MKVGAAGMSEPVLRRAGCRKEGGFHAWFVPVKQFGVYAGWTAI